MSGTLPTAEALFESGPFPHFQKSLGLLRPFGHNLAMRAVVVIAIGWVALTLIATAQGFFGQRSNLSSFLLDLGVHGRSLLAAPLFVLSEAACLSRLGSIARYFVSAGIVEPQDQTRFDTIVASTRTLMNSTVAEIFAVIAAYAIILSLYLYVPAESFPPWYSRAGNVHDGLSPAGWWYALVSLPLLLILLLGWLFRVALWGSFLIRVSRLNLRLVASHPDRASGLKFLNSSLPGFMPLAFTLGVMTAGTVANRVLLGVATPTNMQITVACLLIFVLVLFVGPLMVFALKLFQEKISGVFRYGSLAESVGRQFERKWLAKYDKFGAGALEAPDFSATTDLYQVVANVHEMKVVPFDLKTVLALIAVTLLPFIPIVFMLIPVKVILKEIASLLL